MPSRSIGITFVTTGLVAGLVAFSGPVLRSTEPGTVAPDTLSAVWISEVTMDPIRVVVPYEMRLESVTMEPIRVVIPLEKSATQEAQEMLPRR
ncbi:MAG TPA: hypothetical protein VEY33_09475 [Gemmatimonadota bacterium]|nr:hypothetical protein [Gemmatimonadota bacterium]